MVAPKGNKFWKKRSKHGRDRIFSDADVLWEECQGYFEWVAKNPLHKAELIKFQGKSRLRKDIPVMRAMTISGLSLYLGITQSTWMKYRADAAENNQDFFSVMMRVEEIIRTQKFEGAAAELLNPNIIARDLGLSDKQEVEHSVDKDTLSHAEKLAAARRRKAGK